MNSLVSGSMCVILSSLVKVGSAKEPVLFNGLIIISGALSFFSSSTLMTGCLYMHETDGYMYFTTNVTISISMNLTPVCIS